ncbi:helix-turn-helix transcriptional regulator [Veillonella sp. R32]|uniref:helix-turn-helix domain-containing protein n=1 Tax=Veillonella sp. R32 TaxID=2021312 RepID=UPI001389D405|nr:helix-turn-helix transcriptional regulator [Veillonella sp. R32]KAF1682421.1 transcriptional regulator [Veillonella sp. R32]
MNSFSKRLKETMINQKITQSDLSAMTSIRASSISDWLNDKYSPKQDKIAIIAKALNVRPTWLMGYDETNNEETKDYYEDPEVAALAEEARTNPEIRILFSAAKDISNENMQKTIDFVNFLKSQERSDNDFSE